jgi:hypothetical protein
MAVGSARQVQNGQDTFGGHLFGAVDYSGPASYVQGGDAIDPHVFGFPNTILALYGSFDQTQALIAVPKPLHNGTTVWNIVWQNAAGVESAAGTALNGFTVRLSAIGY